MRQAGALIVLALALIVPGQARAQAYLADCEDTGETAVSTPGSELILVLGQGHSSQLPGRPATPVQLRYGNGSGRLRLRLVDPPAKRFFKPPGLP